MSGNVVIYDIALMKYTKDRRECVGIFEFLEIVSLDFLTIYYELGTQSIEKCKGLVTDGVYLLCYSRNRGS